MRAQRGAGPGGPQQLVAPGTRMSGRRDASFAHNVFDRVQTEILVLWRDIDQPQPRPRRFIQGIQVLSRRQKKIIRILCTAVVQGGQKGALEVKTTKKRMQRMAIFDNMPEHPETLLQQIKGGGHRCEKKMCRAVRQIKFQRPAKPVEDRPLICSEYGSPGIPAPLDESESGASVRMNVDKTRQKIATAGVDSFSGAMRLPPDPGDAAIMNADTSLLNANRKHNAGIFDDTIHRFPVTTGLPDTPIL